MAKDILSKYGKASSTKVKPKGNNVGSWATNVLKSFGYSAVDALQDIVPATVDVATATAQAGKTLVDTVKSAKRGDKQLSTAMKKNFYYGLASEFWKNSLEDIKSGKLYNKDRLDKFYHESNSIGGGDIDDMDFGDMGFGDEDFDTGEESFSTANFESEDGDTRGTVATKSKNGVDVTNVNVVNDLGPDSTMAALTRNQTGAIVDVGTATISNAQSSTRALLSNLSIFRTEVTASLATIDSNIASISTSFADTMGPHTSLAAKFYDDSIRLQTSILEAVQSGASKGSQVADADANTKQFREYQNVMDMFSSGGALDIGAYKNLVKKQANRYVESNLILSQFKNVLDQKDGMMMYAKNPLAFITNSIVKGIIPNLLKQSLQQFDAQLKETGIAALNQLSGFRRSDKPILRAIGEIFGVQNKVNKTLDKSAYNKGAVAWSGTDHQALTNVIPTLLRKMLANQTGTQEIDFDYEKGVFRTVKEMEQDVIETRKRLKTSEYGETLSDFRNFIDNGFGMDDKQKDAAALAMEKFIAKMTMDPYGGMHYRKGGRSGNDDNGRRDDIASAIGGTSDSLNVQLIRSYFTAMEKNRKAELTSLFGSKLQDQRAAYNQFTQTMQNDPLRYNAKYIESGLGGEHRTDAHLKYDKDTGRLSTDRSKSSMGGGVDQFGRSSVSYLRDIVSILGTGVPVLPIISDGLSGRRRRSRNVGNGSTMATDRAALILNRADAARTRLSRDKKRRKDEDKAIQPHYRTRTDSEIRRDVEAGRLEITHADNTNLEQMVAQADAYMTQQDARTNTETFFDKIIGKMPDSAFKNILIRAQEKLSSGQSNIGEFINKADTALFNLVFGNPKKDGRNLFDRVINPLKDKLFGDEGIFKKLDDRLFGPDGLFSKIKQSELMKSLSEKFKVVGNAVSTFILGEKNVDTGDRAGGLLSNTANAFAQIGRDAKDAILGKKGPDGNPLPLDQDDSVLGNIKRIFHAGTDKLDRLFGGDVPSDQVGFDKRLVRTFDAMADRFKERSSELMDNMFGPVGEDGKRSFQRQFVDDLKSDLKGQSGFLGASAVLGAVGIPILGGQLGLLGSMFLPGGPVGGAILGTAIGIATKSSTFQNYLFGKEVDGERTGGLITKEFQDAVKDHKFGLVAGGLAGMASTYGLLPAFLFPGGPIGGVLGGMAISMAAKSGAFENLMFGPGGSKEDPTGGLATKIQDIFGKDKDLKTVALDAGIGAGIGVLGSFFLPGGPIIGALLGAGVSIGTSTERFKNWFFGEKNDESGKREGGIYGKITGFMKEKVFDKLTTATKTAQYKLLSFVETNMAIPFKYALQPLLTEAKHAKDAVTDSIKTVFHKFSDALHKHITEPIGNFLNKFLFNPFKKLLRGIFGGLGKFVGGIISAPFRALGFIGDVSYGAQKRRGKKSYKNQVLAESAFGEEATKQREQAGIKFGLFSQKKYNEDTGKWEKVGKGRIASRFEVTKKLLDREKLREARFNDDGAFYERDQEIERNKRRKLEIKAIREYYKACEIANALGEPTPNKEDFLASYGVKASKKSKKRKDKSTGKNTSNDATNTVSSQSSSGEQYKPSAPPGTFDDSSVDSSVDTTTSPVVANTTSDTIEPNDSAERVVGGDSGNKKKKNRSDKIGRGDRSRNKLHGKKNRSRNSGASSTKVNSDKVTTRIKDTNHDWVKSLSNIDRNVSKICDSVYGQLNGVGSNVNKMYRMLLKKNGYNDDDIQGDNNKERVGFWGKIRTALNRPGKAIKDAIFSPFRKVSDWVNTVNQKFNRGVDTVIASVISIADAGGNVVKKLTSISGVLVDVVGDVRDSVKDVGKTLRAGVRDATSTFVDSVKSTAHNIHEYGKTTIPKLIDNAKSAGTTIVDNVKIVREQIKTKFTHAFDNIGKYFDNTKGESGERSRKNRDTIKSVGSKIKDFAGDKFTKLKEFGSNVKDKFDERFDKVKDVGSKIKDFAGDKFTKLKEFGSNVKDKFGNVFDRVGKVLGPVGSVFGALNPFKLFGTKATHVIVDGGTLDTVKKVKKVKLNEKVFIDGFLKNNPSEGTTPTPPITGGTNNVTPDTLPVSPISNTAPSQSPITPVEPSGDSNISTDQTTESTRKGLFSKLSELFKPNRISTQSPQTNTESSGFMDRIQNPMGVFGDPKMSSNFVNAGKIGLNFAMGGFSPISLMKSAAPAAQMLGISGTTLHGIQGASALSRTLLPFLMFGMNPVSAIQAVFPALQLFSAGKGLFGDLKQFDVKRQAQGKNPIAKTIVNKFKTIGTGMTDITTTAIDTLKTKLSGVITRGDEDGSISNRIKTSTGRLAQVAKGSREALLSKFNTRTKEEEESRYKESMLAATTATAQATSEHKVGWKSIFGKKGLITGALLLALPMLLKIGPSILKFLGNLNIGNLISNVVSNLSQGVSEAGGIGGVTNRALGLSKRAVDGISGETSVNKIDANGNLVFNEDGSFAKEKTDTNIIKEVFAPTRTRVNIDTGEWSNDRTITRSSEELLNYAVVKNKRLIGGTINVAKKVATSKPVRTVAGGVTKITKSAVNKISQTGVGKVAGTAIGAVSHTSQKLLDMFVKNGKEALSTVVTKLIGVAKKLGFNVSASGFDTILKPFIAKVFSGPTIQAFAKKISAFFAKLTGKVAGAVGTAGLLELGFVTYGAIEGATNAAAVFEVRAEDVDWKMRAIATGLKGFSNSSLGSVLDLIDAIGQELSLGSIIKSLASWLYDFISSEEEKQELKNAQAAFTDDYHDYVSKEYDEYKKQAESNGQKVMSEDEFKQSDLVTSRGEYNSKKNKSLTRKVVDSVKSVGSFIKHPIKSIKGAVSGVTHAVSDTVNKIGSFAGKAGSYIGGKVTGASKFLLTLDKRVSDYWDKTTSNVSSAVDDLKAKASSSIASFSAEVKEYGIFGGIVSFFKADTTKAYYDTYGNYYVLQPDGTYTYYNTHGDEIATKINASIVREKLATGFLTEGTIETKSKAKDALSSIKASAGNLWDAAKSTVGKLVNDVTSTASKIASGATSAIGNTFSSVKSFLLGGGKGGTKVAASKGSGEMFNGMPYYSQNDPKYRSKRYVNTESISDNGTIAERGCGPAVMASVASKATGKQYDPVSMANLATIGGFSKDVGTTPDYFTATAKTLGIPSIQTAPTLENIKTSLSLGNSIIMQGRGKSETSPYTEEGHYVTVTGLEGDKVIINDPRGKQTSGKYYLDEVLNNTTGMWSFGSTTGVKSDKTVNPLGGLGSENMTEAEKALVGTMLSIEKKDEYSQDANKRGMVGRGFGDCSSTTQWVYRTALGIDPGGFTGAQIQSPLLKDVDSGGSVPNEDNLRPGDLLFYRSAKGGGHSPTGVSHVEMYIGNGQIMGHGKGIGPFKDSINSRAGRYMKARRYTGEATVQQGAVSDVSGVGAGIVGTSGSSGASESSGFGGFSSITELLGGLASAIANPILEKLGLKASDTSTGTMGTDGTTVGSVSATSIQGDSGKEKTFNFLRANGFTDNAASGAMGCWEEESHNNPYTLEGGYKISNPETKIPQIISSNESLDSYTTGQLFPLYAKSGFSINKSAYMSGGHYYPGFGLAQWTGARGENLLNFARSKGADWGELGTQLEFFLNGPGEFKDRSAKNNLLQKLNAAGSPEDAATEFLDGFEMTPGWHTSTKGQQQNEKRRKHARTIYDAFAGKASDNNTQETTGAGGMGGTTNSKPLDSISTIENKNAAILRDRAEFARKLVKEQLRGKEFEINQQKKAENKPKTAKKKTGKIGNMTYVEQAKSKKVDTDLSKSNSTLVNGIVGEDMKSTKKFTVDAKKSSLTGKDFYRIDVNDTSDTNTEYKPSLNNITDILTKALVVLRDIAVNTGSTTDGIDALNEKEFTATVNVESSGNDVFRQTKPSASKNNVERVPGSGADRSEYKLAKQIASGLFV